MKRIANWFDRFGTKECSRKIIFFFVVSVCLIENPWFGQAHLKELTGGVGMLDMNFANTVTQTNNYLTMLGQQGRDVYLLLLGLDFLIIASFGLLQISFMLRLLKGLQLDYPLKWCVMFPLARGLFDVIETVSMIANVISFPGQISATLYLAVCATPLKWISLWMTLAALLAFMLANAASKIRARICSNEPQLTVL
ncbi:hypothetical protein U14_02158 [Candidatus Moduliflexus flocculans]|uniref:Uncharacterized protein n=1 Tax=Candidatus Moduliflexus flocculans TaxID=1499966 RepID=A0A0S6VX86_9BACT|nr:hypothetical protein U14_02158 [Candidatus Moduliflexus flocculans]